MAMGRKRKHRRDLPQRMREKHGAYYFVNRAGKWHHLGREYHAAISKFAELNNERSPLTTIGKVMDRYQADVIPKKAPRTQRDNLRELELLRSVFGHMRPDEITPVDIYGYMDRRPPVRANREVALLSHVYQHAVRWGAAEANPCKKVSRNTEKPAGNYVEPAAYAAVYAVMPATMQCAMDLALLTGLRQGDILDLKRTDCREDGILVQTSKTGRRILFEWNDELRDVVERCKKLPSEIATVWLIHNRKGQPYTGSGFRAIWQRTIRNAVERGEIQARFAFKDLRTTAASDSQDDNLLGHDDRKTLYRHYKRKPLKVTPLERKI